MFKVVRFLARNDMSQRQENHQQGHEARKFSHLIFGK
jgi:hypothetical protein